MSKLKPTKTTIEYSDLYDFISEYYFQNWLDCEVDSDDLETALRDGFEGNEFNNWENIYGYGKDYEYLEDAFAFGREARRFKNIENFKKRYTYDDD